MLLLEIYKFDFQNNVFELKQNNENQIKNYPEY